MPDDKALLERLRALGGASTSPVQIDVMERAKSPTSGDVLAARFRLLRSKADSPAPRQRQPLPAQDTNAPETTADDVDAVFKTDDNALEEMLAIGPPAEPQDVTALLDQLCASVPADVSHVCETDHSDVDQASQEVDDVIAQCKEEAELDSNPGETGDVPPFELPSAPETAPSCAAIDDILVRMAALRSVFTLPSVPTSRPSKPAKFSKLTSRTRYTDDDMKSWCTVCLEDATLRCIGCEDVYCARCWREMHVGEAAHFDHPSHRAVELAKDDDKEVALGA
ncbi:uncharacterized protein UV8b_01124 [Ustilaginoidea virens]|uniref:Uncharacterized protein n=1 Tax=Ustilaginoidea virens TaxID=1159556 RepID=A0A063C1V2_USTVR|nr:uncharacterized protein UV8b_01124 [Ustilaginoidea virens]QUC16883.1 hypothetical protein UV8b_01124 [Ustilaginoidea virens]GAO19119.1 hypothetical protein UVI_02036100 [Ustilaginoidea virens]